jgi:hypothetical protein
MQASPKPANSGGLLGQAKTVSSTATTVRPGALSTGKAPTGVAPSAPRAPAFRIVSAGRTVRYSKVMVYADYGVGKTTFASSADDVEEMQYVLFIDAEAGDMSLSDRPNIDVVRITSFQQMARVQEFLRLHCQWREQYTDGSPEQKVSAREELIKLEVRFRGRDEEDTTTEPRLYRTVIVDSLSEVQKYCMYQLLGISVGTQRLDVETTTPEWAEWGKQADMIRLLVRTFRDLPMHVIFVCSEQVGEDEKKRRIRKPNLSGKLSGEVQGFLDTVGYMVLFKGEDGEYKRRLYLTPGQTFSAKHRLPGNTTAYIDEPTMAKLRALAPAPAPRSR